MDAEGVDRSINARGKRYFSAMVYRERPELRPFIFGDTMAQIYQERARRGRLPVLGAVRDQGRRPGHLVRVAPGLRLCPREPRSRT